jgi:hypothetical protein
LCESPAEVLLIEHRPSTNENPPNRVQFKPLLLPELIAGGSPNLASGVEIMADGKIKLTASGQSFDNKPSSVIISGSLARGGVGSNQAVIELSGDTVVLDPAKPFESKGRQVRIQSQQTMAGNIVTSGGDFVIDKLSNNSTSTITVRDIDTSIDQQPGGSGFAGLFASGDITTDDITTQKPIDYNAFPSPYIFGDNVAIISDNGFVKVKNVTTDGGNVSIGGSSTSVDNVNAFSPGNSGNSNSISGIGGANIFSRSGDVTVQSIVSSTGGVSISAAKSFRVTGKVDDSLTVRGGTSRIAQVDFQGIALKDSQELIDFFAELKGVDPEELKKSEKKFTVSRTKLREQGGTPFPVSILAINSALAPNALETKVSISYGGKESYSGKSITITGKGDAGNLIIGPQYRLKDGEPKFIINNTSDPDAINPAWLDDASW